MNFGSRFGELPRRREAGDAVSPYLREDVNADYGRHGDWRSLHWRGDGPRGGSRAVGAAAARRSLLAAVAAGSALALPLGATAGATADSGDSTGATASWKRTAWSNTSRVGSVKLQPR